jgi:hypothetical protein
MDGDSQDGDGMKLPSKAALPTRTLSTATDAPIRKDYMIGDRYQNGCLMLAKNKSTPDTWFLRFYEDKGGKRVYRKQRIGTVRELPYRRDAEKATHSLRAKINTPHTEARSPETVSDLIAHYSKHELNLDRKSFSTVDVGLSVF